MDEVLFLFIFVRGSSTVALLLPLPFKSQGIGFPLLSSAPPPVSGPGTLRFSLFLGQPESEE